ncbi:MAG TPA: hypothetical protein VG498_23060 [Terriglobales bacterium]|nr:hypothetical protein [Terriglobales bacterium]
MRKVVFLLMMIALAIGLSACGNYSSSMPGANQTPSVTGNWNVVFTPAAASASTTSLTISFTQNGNALNGTVSAVNNPSGSCFPAIAATGTTFTVTGQVSSAASSIVNLSVGFTSGSSSGTIAGNATLAYLGTMANGTFTFATGASGCTSGALTMTKTS